MGERVIWGLMTIGSGIAFRGNENVLKVVAMDGQLHEYVKIH